MLKQSKGIIYVQGKETKDATLIGLAYMDKVELKNKIMTEKQEIKLALKKFVYVVVITAIVFITVLLINKINLS